MRTGQIAAMGYDAFGRRVVKDIDNSGDWDCKYMYTFDGQRKIEKRNASGWVLEQYVWGGRYVDELVQIGLNQDSANPVLAAACRW